MRCRRRTRRQRMAQRLSHDRVHGTVEVLANGAAARHHVDGETETDPTTWLLQQFKCMLPGHSRVIAEHCTTVCALPHQAIHDL